MRRILLAILTIWIVFVPLIGTFVMNNESDAVEDWSMYSKMRPGARLCAGRLEISRDGKTTWHAVDARRSTLGGKHLFETAFLFSESEFRNYVESGCLNENKSYRWSLSCLEDPRSWTKVKQDVVTDCPTPSL